MREPVVEPVLREGGRRVALHRLADGDTGRTLVLCHPAPGAGHLLILTHWQRALSHLAPGAKRQRD